MSTIVLQLEAPIIQQIKSIYKNSSLTPSASYIDAMFDVNGTKITIYHSKKVMFQGKDAAVLAAPFQQQSIQKKPKSSRVPSVLPDNISTASVIGSDETGTGDYFGPMTVAACYVAAQDIGWLTELGVKDSKMLTDERMRTLAPLLQESLTHSVLVLPNKKYNEIQPTMNQGKMKAMMHNQALLHVLRKLDTVEPDWILIDQFAESNTYFNYLVDAPHIVKEKVCFATKAEQIHVSVAAASIIARVAFLNEMDQLSQQLGISIPKGAGAKVDEVAARILKKFGEETLHSMTKWHFANTQKAKKLTK